MADRQRSPADTREQAVAVREAWTVQGAAQNYGSYVLADLQAALTALDATDATIANIEAQLTEARNDRLTKRHELWELLKRVRTGVKAEFGDDSNEYEMFGGTRMSERG